MDHFPLRSTIGRILRVPNVSIGAGSSFGDPSHMQSHTKFSDALGIDRSAFFPRLLDPATGVEIGRAANGSGAMPADLLDAHYQFSGASYISLAINPHENEGVHDDSVVEIVLDFGGPLRIGGIGLLGHPYLPQNRTEDAGNAANFGLPQEVSLLPDDAGADEFVDAQTQTLIQNPERHSGLNIFSIRPTLTSQLIVRFGNLPRLATQVDLDGKVVTDAVGLLISALFVFEYGESVRYKPRAAIGLIASAIGKPDRSIIAPSSLGRPVERIAATRGRVAGAASTSIPDIWPQFFVGADQYRPVGHPKEGKQNYVVDTAASTVMVPRQTRVINEVFCSPKLHLDEDIWFYLEQAEEFARSIAAIEVTFGRQKPGMGPRPPLDIEVYSVDPSPGETANIWPDSPKDHKSHTLLASKRIARIERRSRIRFHQPNTQKVLLVRLINKGAKGDAFTLTDLQVLRSAHQVVVPRASRRQRIDRMHYRIVGASLAEDYARIGKSQASLRVTLEKGRNADNVIFEAQSLLDLMQNGGRLIANHRYWHQTKTVTDEKTQTHADHNTRETGTSAQGWRTSDQGPDVEWNEDGRLVHPDGSSNAPGDFHAYSSSETRTQTEHIGHETAGDLVNVMSLLDQVGLDSNMLNLRQNLDANGDGLIDNQPPRLREDDGPHSVSWLKVWQHTPDVGYVGMLSHLTLPPYIHALTDPGPAIEGLQKLATLPDDLSGFINDPLGAATELGAEVAPLAEFLKLVASSAIGNLSFSLGGQLIGGVSLSATTGQLVPQLSYSSTEGVAGMITKQGTRSNHSHSQIRNQSYDHVKTESKTTHGHSHRSVTTVHDEDKSRRERRSGTEVRWQGRDVDIVTGSVSIDINLPSLRDEIYGTLDHTIRVTVDQGKGEDALEIDVWFDIFDQIVWEED